MSADTPRSPAAPGESLEGAHQALHSTLAALVARLRRADEATLAEVKATLTTLASSDNGSRVRDELENLAKGELLEVKWEIEEVIEATTPKKAPPPAPPPAPAPAVETPDQQEMRRIGDHFGLRDLAADARRRDSVSASEAWFGGEATFDVIDLREDVAAHGQRIESFRIDAWDGESWSEIARGGTVGMRRLVRIEPKKARGVRCVITGSRGEPKGVALSVHCQPEKPK
jgi:hypothetical protein